MAKQLLQIALLFILILKGSNAWSTVTFTNTFSQLIVNYEHCASTHGKQIEVIDETSREKLCGDNTHPLKETVSTIFYPSGVWLPFPRYNITCENAAYADVRTIKYFVENYQMGCFEDFDLVVSFGCKCKQERNCKIPFEYDRSHRS